MKSLYQGQQAGTVDSDGEVWAGGKYPRDEGMFNVGHPVQHLPSGIDEAGGGEDTGGGRRVGLGWRWVPGSSFAGERRWEKGRTETRRVVVSSALFADDTTIKVGRTRCIERVDRLFPCVPKQGSLLLPWRGGHVGILSCLRAALASICSTKTSFPGEKFFLVIWQNFFK